MTTQRQKNAVQFCEKWLGICFDGDINKFSDVSTFLSLYLEDAKIMSREISCEYAAYLDELYD